jgi:hypothetical protein
VDRGSVLLLLLLLLLPPLGGMRCDGAGAAIGFAVATAFLAAAGAPEAAVECVGGLVGMFRFVLLSRDMEQT